MSFMEEIKAQTDKLKDPSEMRKFKMDRLINCYKASIQRAANIGRSNLYIGRLTIAEEAGFDPDRLDLSNSFAWLDRENIKYKYEWNNLHRDFYLQLDW